MSENCEAIDLEKLESQWEHVDLALRMIAKRRGALDALEAK